MRNRKTKFITYSLLLAVLTPSLDAQAADAPAPSKNAQVSALIKKGINQAKEKDYRQAINSFNEALAIDPNSFDVFVNRGWTSRQIGDFNGAIADYTSAIKLNPSKPQVYLNRGWCHKRLNQYDEALQDFNKALELDPKYLNAYRNRGSLKLKMGDYQGSVADFNQLLVLDPDAKSEVAKYVPKEYMDQVTKMDPKQAAAIGSQVAAAFSGTQVELSNADLAKLNNRAARAIKAGEFASAISILEELTKKKPNYTYAKDNLATAYNNQGMKFAVDNPEQSAAQFRKAMFYSSQQATTRRNLNSMLTQMGKDPESAQVRIALGDELKAQKDYKGAFVEYMEAMRLKDGTDARAKIAEVCALLETEKLTAGANTTSLTAALPSKASISGEGMIHPPEANPKPKKQEGYVENSAEEEPLTLPPTIGLDTKFDTEGKQQSKGGRAKLESAQATALDLNPPPKAPIGEDLETLRVKWKNHLDRGDEQFENGNYVDSEQEYKDSLLTAKRLGDDSLEVISSLERMARIFLVQKRSFEALSLLEQAYTLRKDRQEDPDPVHLERLGNKVLALKKILYPNQDPKKENQDDEEEPDDSDTEKTASADGAEKEDSSEPMEEESSADAKKPDGEKRKITGIFKRKKSEFEKEMEVLDKKESDTRNSFDTRPSWAEFNR